MNKIINELRKQGFDNEQIKNALCDGEFLGQLGATQEEVEDAYDELDTDNLLNHDEDFRTRAEKARKGIK